ncbi:MAG: hypothetical protein EXX96DRAFT_606981 [Benjaminiella poitrasii]|nr:MAG: hypothetical protein EXX96DRAFT_606981 [Benjaminiella poitrasii]
MRSKRLGNDCLLDVNKLRAFRIIYIKSICFDSKYMFPISEQIRLAVGRPATPTNRYNECGWFSSPVSYLMLVLKILSLYLFMVMGHLLSLYFYDFFTDIGNKHAVK